ncbi:MAG: DNA polymerase III subunit delta [Clostridia bacterium]|nr:DNA polymerase III subunit delta [Clostridia bacterium]
MSALTEDALKEKIKSSPFGAYLLYGEETFLVKVYTDKLVKASVGDAFSDFNLRVFENDDCDLNEIYDSALAVPMMAEGKCVLVRNYPAAEAEDSDLALLKELLADNPPDNCLIFSYPALQPSASEIGEIVKLFNEKGIVVKFGKKQMSDLVKIVESGAKKRGKTFERGVAEYMVSCVGNDLNLLGNELEKVCAYCGETVRRGDVDAVCIKTLEAKVFDMVGELVNGNFDKAFRMLSNLFAKREDEYMILGALISQYTDIYRAKAAVKNSKNAVEVAAAYPSLYKGKDFKLKRSVRPASTMTFEQLDSCLEILADADRALKSTQQDKKQVLEYTLVRLARAGGRKV